MALDLNEEHVADLLSDRTGTVQGFRGFCFIKIQIKMPRKAGILYGHCLMFLFVFAEHSFEKFPFS